MHDSMQYLKTDKGRKADAEKSRKVNAVKSGRGKGARQKTAEKS